LLFFATIRQILVLESSSPNRRRRRRPRPVQRGLWPGGSHDEGYNGSVGQSVFALIGQSFALEGDRGNSRRRRLPPHPQHTTLTTLLELFSNVAIPSLQDMSIPSQNKAVLKALPEPPPEDSTMRVVRLIDSRVAVVAVISSLIASRMRAYRLVPVPPALELTCFHALKLPDISPVAYISRLACYAECSKVAMLAALSIADRAAVADPRLVMTPFCVHRVMLTSLVLASKYHDDLSFPLSYYATVGGIPVHELVNLEHLLLKTVEWSVGISAEDFEDLERDARAEAAQGPAGLAAKAELRCTGAGMPPLVPFAPLSAVSVGTMTALASQAGPSEHVLSLPDS
jgi:hypothetical protein